MRLRFVAPAVVTATLALCTVSSVGYADPTPQDVAQARELGGQAQQAFDAGNFAESEKLWVAAQNLYPAAPTLTLGLARTQAKLGKLVLATEAYNKIIREQGEKSNLSATFKDALDAAKAEVGPVQSRIANVVITIEGGAPSPTVTLDGQPVSVAGLGLKRPVDPGQHTLKAEATGYKPAQTQFQVAEAGLAETKLTLEKAEGGAPGGPATTTQPSPAGDQGAQPQVSTRGGTSNKTFALVAFGVGGLGLVFGTVTGIIALGKHGDLSDKCPDSKCPTSAQSDVDSYKTMGTLATVGFIAAGVGAAAGAVLWFTAPKDATTAGREWHPYVGAGTAGVAGRF